MTPTCETWIKACGCNMPSSTNRTVISQVYESDCFKIKAVFYPMPSCEGCDTPWRQEPPCESPTEPNPTSKMGCGASADTGAEPAKRTGTGPSSDQPNTSATPRCEEHGTPTAPLAQLLLRLREARSAYVERPSGYQAMFAAVDTILASGEVEKLVAALDATTRLYRGEVERQRERIRAAHTAEQRYADQVRRAEAAESEAAALRDEAQRERGLVDRIREDCTVHSSWAYTSVHPLALRDWCREVDAIRAAPP